jgi:hypothetical protein
MYVILYWGKQEDFLLDLYNYCLSEDLGVSLGRLTLYMIQQASVVNTQIVMSG